MWRRQMQLPIRCHSETVEDCVRVYGSQSKKLTIRRQRLCAVWAAEATDQRTDSIEGFCHHCFISSSRHSLVLRYYPAFCYFFFSHVPHGRPFRRHFSAFKVLRHSDCRLLKKFHGFIPVDKFQPPEDSDYIARFPRVDIIG